MKLFLDLETRSPVPIKHGAAKYSTKVEIIMAQWAIDEGEVVVEDLTGSPPPSKTLLDAARRADEVWAHGAEFETHALATVPWWPVIPQTKWRCTMALARMHGLPGALAKLSEIFKLGADEAKDKRGYELIQLFCIPRKDGLYNDKHSHPKQWAEFLVYGSLDVSAMRAVWWLCPKWNSTPRMWSLWHLDQRMNARGVAMDLKLAQGAVGATSKAKARMADRTEELTLGMVERTTQRDRLLAYMADSGVDLPDLTADTVERRLEDESLPEHIKELLRVRQQASKASTAKYKRVLAQHVAGRLRNLLVFCGASRTGRWAGRTLQPQNLPRPRHEQWDIDHAITRFHDGTIAQYAPDEVLGLASSALRGLIVSAPGRKLVVSDLANIEGRYMAWVAGESWKLEAFAAFDRKEGADLYKIAYARIFNITPDDVTEPQRQIGKVCVAGNTLVICRGGLKRLDAITENDEVWDGDAWIKHAGLVCNGKRPVLTLCGVSLTPDHLVWSEGTWQRADALERSGDKLRSALMIASASLPLRVLWSALKAECALLLSAVIVKPLSTWCCQTILNAGYLLAAICAPMRLVGKSGIGSTLVFYATRNTADGCSTDSLLRSQDATAEQPSNFTLTARAVFLYAMNGVRIGRRFLSTCKLLKVGTSRASKWIGAITAKVTNRVICGLYRSEKTTITEEPSGPLRQNAVVYDLLSCGPKNRFMIWSADGPLMVHNCELALQYYGGVGAFCSMAETYGLRLEDLAKSAWPVIPATYKREAKIGWGRAVKRHRTYGLDERTWMVCQALVLMWRAAHPAICKFWEDLDRACTLATHTANKEYKVGSHISVDRVGNWLRIKLPSGRYLSYPAPRGDDFTSSFMGVDPYTKQWKRISTYSGKRAENIVQGGSADILMDGLLAADEDGYNPVLSVHDEAITEPPDTEGYTDKALSKLLIESSLWADGMPLAAKGFTAKRYRK
jgi:hypothetical protein